MRREPGKRRSVNCLKSYLLNILKLEAVMKNILIVAGVVLSVAAAVLILLAKKPSDETGSAYDQPHF